MKKTWAVVICIAIVFLNGCIGGTCLAEKSYNIVVLPEDEVSEVTRPEKENSER